MIKTKRIGPSNEILQLDLTKFRGRVFYSTDLHGHYELLHEKLKSYAFNSESDLLVLGADMCDRGPDSQHVLDYLNEPWVHCIRGNHEQLLIAAYEEDFCGPATNCLLGNGGIWIANVSDDLMKAIYESFKSLPLAIELLTPTETIGIIHAQCPYNSWDEFKKMTKAEMDYNGGATAQWARTNYDKQANIQIKGVDRLIVGHSPTRSGEVEVYGNTTYADLGSFFRGKISFIQLM